MSPIDPRVLGSPGLPPGADVYRRLAELEARCAKIERGDAAGWTYAEDSGSEVLSTGSPTGAIRCARQLNVPAAGKAVRALGVVYAQGTGAASGSVAGRVMAQDDSGAWVVQFVPWYAVVPGGVAADFATNAQQAVVPFGGLGEEVSFLSTAGSVLAGARQWAVQFRHQGGATDVTLGKIRLWLGWA